MFEHIVGNDNVKKTLKSSVDLNTISHSYLFIGKSGIGKQMIAKEFAKMILCIDEKKYCNKCKSCIEFDSNNNPDFIIINAENGNIKINQIRELQKVINEKPIISGCKVCIVNDADLMTKEAQNCLLKTLEEPPEYMTIILVGTNESDFLPTIKSRCLIIHFEKIKDNEMKKYIQDNFEVIDDISTLIDIADGSIGKAINLKRNDDIYLNVKNIIENVEKYDIIEIFKKADCIYRAKDEIFGILEYINVLLIKQSMKNYRYANCIEIVEETRKRIKSNSNYSMCLDYMLLSIWREVNEKYSRSKI